MNTAQRVAKALLSINAVSLSSNKPYVWASGILSPIYCDNRITLAYPEIRQMIAKDLSALILEYYPDVEVIAGTATAGIPQACWVADRLNLPMVYIRSKPKDHGKGNQIEGGVQVGKKVVVIDDLISTGTSVLDACQAARDAGFVVLGVAAIFSYQLPKGVENFKLADLPCVSLSDYASLIELARQEGIIDENQIEHLMQWRKDPYAWMR